MGKETELTGADKLRAQKAFEAAELWMKIETNLRDRGCFNGIDDDVMDELRLDLLNEMRDYMVEKCQE